MPKILRQNSLLIKLVISAAILILLFMRMNMEELSHLNEYIHSSAWVIAFIFICAQILALSYRWLLLANVHEKTMTYADSIRITLASFIANYLFITSVGGIIVRVALAIQHGMSWVRAITATFLDRLMTLVALLILSVVFLPVLSKIVSPDIYKSAAFLLLTCFTGICIFSVLLAKDAGKKLVLMNRKIALCYKYLRSISSNNMLVLKIVLSSLLGQLCYFVAVYAVAISTGVDFPITHLLAVLPMITIVASLPIGYGGWGIREGAFVYGLGLINIPIETAFLVSVQIGLISMACALITGIPALLSGESKAALNLWKKTRAQE